jgi:hypothetical protein
LQAPIDADFAGRSFATAPLQRTSTEDLPLVCNILKYGDIWQWAAVLADRQVTLRNVAQNEQEQNWLEAVFANVGKKDNLKQEKK